MFLKRILPLLLPVFLCSALVAGFIFLKHQGVGEAQAQITQRPFIPMYPTVDTSSTAYIRFKAYVDRAVAGSPDYGFRANDAAIMYRITGDSKYSNLAISMVDTYVAQEESAIAAGTTPNIASDSYLYVGDHMEDVSVVYDWMYTLLTPIQRSRFIAYGNQAIYNVWNPTTAKWGSKTVTWSGWSINNPGNNYYYSFVQATIDWALATQNQQWLDYLKNDRLPLLTNYFKNLPGGGSREGTGYGTSHARLFDIYRIWKEATGQDLSMLNSHAKDTIDYWIHATLPTMGNFAPIGDQSRVSDAAMYDYQRRLMLQAVYLNPGTPEAANGTWWLNNIVIQYADPPYEMSSAFNLRYDFLYLANQLQQVPTALKYYASGVGHLFARTDWTKNATWLQFSAGTYEESHAHQDQGSFMLFKNGWLAIDEVINSHSGIGQTTDLHNVVRFQRSSTVIGQTYNSTSTMTNTDTNGILNIQADLSPAYNPTDVQSWKRNLIFNRNNQTVQVHDTFTPGSGVQGIWQLNVPAEPVVNQGSITAGNLLITPVTPANYSVNVIDWKALDSSEYPDGGWRIDIGGGNDYLVNLSLVDGGTVLPSPSPSVTPTPRVTPTPTITPTPPPINSAPTITISQDHYTVRIGETLSIPITAQDADGDTITLTIPNLSTLLPGATLK